MSSHHIVRENQEPALLILNPHGLADNLFHQLLEWSPTLITLAENYETLHSRGIKVDVLLYGVTLPINMSLEENLEVISYEQDYLPKLFDYLTVKKNVALTIIGEQLTVAQLKPWLADFSLTIIHGNFKFVIVKQYEKWLPAGSILVLPSPLTSGLNLQDLGHQRFQVVQDGFVRIDTQPDYVLIGEEL